jgi:hypothetical protein
MSTNIKLLIALLLGAAIGALVMKQTTIGEPQWNIIDYGENAPKSDNIIQPSKYEAVLRKNTESITFKKAKEFVQKYQRAALDSGCFPIVRIASLTDTSTQFLESVVIEKEKLLTLLGVRTYTDAYPKIKGVRCYFAENDEFKEFQQYPDTSYQGNTIVCIPTDKDGYNIVGSPSQTFYEALEYHMPCPKHCKSTPTTELSIQQVISRRIN